MHPCYFNHLNITLLMRISWGIWMALQFGSWIDPSVLGFLLLKFEPPVLSFFFGRNVNIEYGPVCDTIDRCRRETDRIKPQCWSASSVPEHRYIAICSFLLHADPDYTIHVSISINFHHFRHLRLLILWETSNTTKKILYAIIESNLSRWNWAMY